MKKKSVLWLIATSMFITQVQATAILNRAESIQVQLTDPQWQFLLDTRPLQPKEAQLTIAERSFSQKIQPLLSAGQYQAVHQAFLDRPIEQDSAALRQLRGQVLLSLKHYDLAEQALQSALTLMPDLALAHRSLSMVYMVRQQYHHARRHLRRSIELGVADAQLYGQLAFVNLQTHHAASAVSGYQQALFMEPQNQQWQQGLLYALVNSQAFDQAQALVDQLLQQDSQRDNESASLWLLRSQIALKRNQPVQALYSLEIAIHLGDKQPDNLASAAQLHLQHGSIKRAITLLEADLTQADNDSITNVIDTFEQVTAWLVYQQHWSAVSRVLQIITLRKPQMTDTSQARFAVYRAQLALQDGQTAQAQQQFERALVRDPSHGEALIALADLHMRQQQFAQARPYYVRAAALTDYKERALLSQAQLEIDQQSYAQAVPLLQQVLQLNPNRSDVLANLKTLEQLIRDQG